MEYKNYKHILNKMFLKCGKKRIILINYSL